MTSLKILGTVFLCTILSGFYSCSGKKDTITPAPPVEPVSQVYRGVTITSHATEKDITDLKSYGVNVVRVLFGYYKLISKIPPYEYNEAEFKNLDNIISWCEKNGIRVVVNPHTAPGFVSNNTTVETDPFWKDVAYQDILVNLWKKISDRYKDKGSVIYGYDLLNEPYVPDDQDIWNNLVTRLTKTIRDNGDKHPIVVEANVLKTATTFIDYIDNLNNLKLPVDDSVVLSVHFYKPGRYTHQQVVVGSYPDKISYNDPVIGGKATVIKNLQPLVNYHKAHPKLRIYIGEFSVTRTALDGNEYIKDVVDIFEEQGWDWTYHSFRESPVWDAEMPLGSTDATTRSSNAERITLLKTYFNKNK